MSGKLSVWRPNWAVVLLFVFIGLAQGQILFPPASSSGGASECSDLSDAGTGCSANISLYQTLLSSSNKLGLAAGGTNANLSATGGTAQFLLQNTVGGAIVPTRPTCSSLSDAGTACTATIALYATLANPSFTGTVLIGTTSLSATHGVLMPVTISTSGPVTVTATGLFYNNAAGALTYNLPTITSANIGVQFCFRSSPTRTGVITLQAPASTFIDINGTNGTAAGTMTSGGALGDAACVIAVSTTQYMGYPGHGTWSVN